MNVGESQPRNLLIKFVSAKRGSTNRKYIQTTNNMRDYKEVRTLERERTVQIRFDFCKNKTLVEISGKERDCDRY